jgi:hypothetical protein
MAMPPEVMSAIIKVAGEWSGIIVKTPESFGKTAEPSQMYEELENHFSWAFFHLASVIENYLTNR